MKLFNRGKRSSGTYREGDLAFPLGPRAEARVSEIAKILEDHSWDFGRLIEKAEGHGAYVRDPGGCLDLIHGKPSILRFNSRHQAKILVDSGWKIWWVLGRNQESRIFDILINCDRSNGEKARTLLAKGFLKFSRD